MQKFLFQLITYSLLLCIITVIFFVPTASSAVMTMQQDTLLHGTPIVNLDAYFDGFDTFYMFCVMAIGFIVKSYGNKVPFLRIIPNVGWRVSVAVLFFAMAFMKFHPHDVSWYLLNTSAVMKFYDHFIKPFMPIPILQDPIVEQTPTRVLPIVD
jgi:hypothetical protein